MSPASILGSRAGLGAAALAALLLLHSAPSHSAGGTGAAPRKQVEISFEPVTTRVGGGWVDWSELVLHVSAGASPAAGPLADRSVVEQHARDELEPIIHDTAPRIPFTSERSAGDIIAQGDNAGRLLDRGMDSWRVTLAHYYSSGKVELEAELDLFQWAARPLMTMAKASRPVGVERSQVTGIVVDARGLELEPVLAPAMLSSQGAVLYSVESITPAALKKHSPVQYVSDPADPRAVERAGASPVFLAAQDTSGRHDLVLDADNTRRLLEATRDPHLLAEARVVVVTGH